jgi:hypothetical protein
MAVKSTRGGDEGREFFFTHGTIAAYASKSPIRSLFRVGPPHA